jgi:signal transduction histidine kinase
MKRISIRLPQQYAVALRKHLKQGSPASLQGALRVGRQAVVLELETLALARIHEQALATVEIPKNKASLLKRADIFFYEANAPIEETHRAARQTKAHLSRLIATLGRRTEELAVSNRQLQRGVRRHKVVEDASAKRGRHHQKCLEESLELQKRLRQLTHQVMRAQEDERKKISCELQDDIAQTLLGINVRLLSLKLAAQSNTKGIKNHIASTQQLVAKSAISVRQVGQKIGSL